MSLIEKQKYAPLPMHNTTSEIPAPMDDTHSAKPTPKDQPATHPRHKRGTSRQESVVLCLTDHSLSLQYDDNLQKFEKCEFAV